MRLTFKNNRMMCRNQGLSLIELLVAMGLSLLLLIGVITIFTSTRGSFEVNDRTARIQENGRFAIDVISRDIRSAGYTGCKRNIDTGTGTTTATTLNKPAALTLVADYDVYDVAAFNFVAASTWSPALSGTDLAWLTSSGIGPANGSDVLLLRRPRPDTTSLRLVADMTAADADIKVTPMAANPPFENHQVMMISSCDRRAFFESTDYNAATGTIQHALASSGTASGRAYLGNSTASLNDVYQGPRTGGGSLRDHNQAMVTAMQTVIYFVRPRVVGALNSLYRRVDTNAPEELVEGIDSMQIQLGIDNDNDGTADVYQSPGAGINPNNVVSVSVTLLVRSLDEYGSIATDSTTYDLLQDGNGTGFNTDDFTAPGDHRLRQRFTLTSSLRSR